MLSNKGLMRTSILQSLRMPLLVTARFSKPTLMTLDNPMNLEEIQRLVGEGRYEFSFHAQQQRLDENLDITELEDAIVSHGEILEIYPDDPRGESCLILGFTVNGAVHVVVGWARTGHDVQILRVVTAYVPRAPKWLDARTRGERS
jgi:hypothetical protein